jgi:hypothetical protein
VVQVKRSMAKPSKLAALSTVLALTLPPLGPARSPELGTAEPGVAFGGRPAEPGAPISDSPDRIMSDTAMAEWAPTLASLLWWLATSRRDSAKGNGCS